MGNLHTYFYTMKRYFIQLVSVVLLLSACAESEVEKQLLDIESYIMERPDSALAALESMDPNLLKTEEDKAYHALLHAMALDKNFIDIADDSLARIAVDYYSEHGPEKYHARSLYYLGLAYYYQEEYNKAIVEFTKAEKVAERVDSLYLGFIKNAQAASYNESYNAGEVLKYMREVCDIYLNLGNQYYIQTSKLYLSQTLYNLHRIDESSALLKELINGNNTDVKVKLSAMVAYAFINAVELYNYDKAIELYNEVLNNSSETYMSFRDYWALAYCLNAVGRKEEAQNLIDQLACEESGTTSYWQYMIAKSNGDVETALSYLEDYIKYNDVEVSDALKQSLAISQRDYFESQSELSKAEAESSRLLFLVVLLSSSVVLLAAGICVIWYVRKQRKAKEQYILYISEIHRQLEEAKKDDYPALKRKYMALYKSKFETIGTLCEQYAHSHDLVHAETSIYKKVVSLVDDFTNDYTNREKFEAMLNADLDNIMSNLRSEMPSLKEKDYVIFSFLVIGFDVTTISNLLNITANTVYIRKCRIRHQIEEHNPAHKSQYIEAIG